jgi:hypothetical protein
MMNRVPAPLSAIPETIVAIRFRNRTAGDGMLPPAPADGSAHSPVERFRIVDWRLWRAAIGGT